MQKCGGKDRIDGPAKIDGLIELVTIYMLLTIMIHVVRVSDGKEVVVVLSLINQLPVTTRKAHTKMQTSRPSDLPLSFLPAAWCL